MTSTVADKRAAFAKLHQAGCFALPNPYDAGTAIALQRLGFNAVATTSAGMAWSMGRADGGAGLEEVLAHLAGVAAAVDIPVNADFEGGLAVAPDAVAANVARAAQTGIAGLSIEDSSGDAASPLYDLNLAVERIAAARQAIDRSGPGVVLTARSEGFVAGRPDLAETIRRLVAFSEAGADCLYAPGLREASDISEVVRAVAPKPVNVLTLGQSLAELTDLGVRRVSVGGSLARVAWGAFLAAAREIKESGTFSAFAKGASGRDLNAMFAQHGPR
ncbi:MAG TPA: isocitrate lyase/phosphoenolpyruvate mutase family protein [Caulobacteraceae bacterium]|nr:isocitrate lyase/phosphoenolpyruvate mutase family protein [Caulobacteraceae bacterium]